MSPLQSAFQQSRAERNIDLVLPALKAALLYVVVGVETKPGRQPEWFLTPSPAKDRLCVTASETEAALARIRWPKAVLSGADLLAALPTQIEILLVYQDGADYITREHLDWHRRSR